MSIVAILFAWMLARPALAGAPTPQASPTPATQAKSRPPARQKPIPRGKGIQVVPTNVTPITIVPRPDKGPKPPAYPTGFKLTPAGAGKLRLSYLAKNPLLILDPRGSLVIQLTTDEPVELDPSIITRADWPKTGNSLPIAYKGAQRGKKIIIQGKATYTVCDSKTKDCHKVITPIYAELNAQ